MPRLPSNYHEVMTTNSQEESGTRTLCFTPPILSDKIRVQPLQHAQRLILRTRN